MSMADYGTAVVNQPPTMMVVTSFGLGQGIPFGTAQMYAAANRIASGYSLSGTTPCPEAPLVGQWWPR